MHTENAIHTAISAAAHDAIPATIHGEDWNPYYVAYAAAHGETDPTVMRERDTHRSGRRSNVRYMQWIEAQWLRWETEVGRPQHSAKGPREHGAFAAWLWERVATPAVRCEWCGVGIEFRFTGWFGGSEVHQWVRIDQAPYDAPAGCDVQHRPTSYPTSSHGCSPTR